MSEKKLHEIYFRCPWNCQTKNKLDIDRFSQNVATFKCNKYEKYANRKNFGGTRKKFD